MTAAKHAAGVYLIAVGIAVVAQFLFGPVYGGDGSQFDTWAVLNWLMAAGLLIALAVAIRDKFRLDGGPVGPSDWLRYLEVNVTYYAALGVAILFFANWIGLLWGPGSREQWNWVVWAIVDTALPLLFASVGLRVWREALAEGGGP